MDQNGIILCDCWPLPSGELGVRPSLTPALEFSPSPQLNEGFRAVYSYRVSTTDAPRAIVTQASGGYSLRMLDLENGEQIQSITLSKLADLWRMSACVVEGRLIVAVPGDGLFFGWDSGTLERLKRPSAGIFSDLETAYPPEAQVVEWNGRAVYSDGFSVWVSDPLLPRAVISPANTAPIPGGGAIQRLFSAPGGDLWLVGSSRTYLMRRDVLLEASSVQFSFEEVSAEPVRDFHATAWAAGRPWALTPDGVVALDGSGTRLRLVPHTAWGLDNYRPPSNTDGARLYGHGDWLGCDFGDGVVAMADARTGFASLWNLAELGSVWDRMVGFWLDADGRVGVATAQGLQSFEMSVDADGSVVRGGFVVADAGGPNNADHVRALRIRTDAPGGVTGGINGDSHSETSHESRAPAPGVVTNWSAETIGLPSMERFEIRLDLAGDERSFHAEVSGSMSRLDLGEIRTMSNGPERTHQ